MSEHEADAVAAVAEDYYDSDDAESFYSSIWGGEDIHIGLYDEGGTPIREASRRTVERMADQIRDRGPDTRVLDLGAGYGGSARYLAHELGWHVTCLNISEVQNDRNRTLNREWGVEDLVDVLHGSFEDVPDPAEPYEVVWSQDAFLHSGNRRRVLEEARRVMAPGGELVFTDPMQSDDCPADVLQPILDRIHLDTLGSPGFYRENLADLGFEEVAFVDLTEHLGRHYATVRRELAGRHERGEIEASDDYVQRMLQGLQHWVDGADNGWLSWGILHFRLTTP